MSQIESRPEYDGLRKIILENESFHKWNNYKFKHMLLI